jgi:hypothetical protein
MDGFTYFTMLRIIGGNNRPNKPAATLATPVQVPLDWHADFHRAIRHK